MAKVRTQFVCQQCGYSQVGWAGRCPNCGEWNSLVESRFEEVSVREIDSKGKSDGKPVKLSSVPSRKTQRTLTKISELDRVLGGGLVPGQVVLLAGEPGIGKSTLLLQLAQKLGDTLYVSGEESSQQIKIRADRLGVTKKSIHLLEETDVDRIIDLTNLLLEKKEKISLLIVDSIQTLATTDLSGMPGSVGQVRESAFRLLRLAKKNNLPLFLVGHVTKEGSVAGPAVLAHMVDSVLWFEGDKSLTLRLLRAVKNRFGSTDEVGIFEMKEKGLIPIDSSEKLFLSQEKKSVPGSCIASILEGTRPFLVEIQSLVVPTKLAFPKRTAQGIDSKRVELILAVLQRRAGLPMADFDVFVNIIGGIKVKETGVDLAIALALASAYFDKPLPQDLVAIGEIGLLGEIREVLAQERRVKEAKRLGFKRILTKKEAKFISQAIKSYLK